MRIIAVTNQKGGVGKTTICASVCGCLNKIGKSVLAIDLDPQGNLSFSLGAEFYDNMYTLYNVMKGQIELHDAIQHTEYCDIAPSNITLSGLELELTSVGREYILRDQLELIATDYDYVIIDTPPALSILTINAYTAADWLIIPMLGEILSLQGLSQLKETIFAVKKYFNKSLEVRGILINKYNPRLILTKEVEELAAIVSEQLNTEVFETKIGQSISVAEAPAHGKPISEYAPRSRSAEEFESLTYEILGREKPKKVIKKLGRGRPRKYQRPEEIEYQ
ncbi:MAG: ParA family protein [Eubacterium sp.]|jgi:chromosome partitioning protein|nr:ParA family protein [Eubacterium sp.]